MTLSNEVLKKYKTVEPATLGHFVNFGFNTVDIHVTKPNCRCVGRAVTLRVPSMDSTLCHKVAEFLNPGDILMVDRAGDMQYASIGGGVAYSLYVRHPEAVIIDGAMTDFDEIEALSTPFFYRRLSAITTRILGTDGEINTPINCCGVEVHPGDIVVADRNGFVVLKPETAVQHMEKALQMQDEEERILKAHLDAGKFLSDLWGANKLIEKAMKE